MQCFKISTLNYQFHINQLLQGYKMIMLIHQAGNYFHIGAAAVIKLHQAFASRLQLACILLWLQTYYLKQKLIIAFVRSRCERHVGRIWQGVSVRQNGPNLFALVRSCVGLTTVINCTSGGPVESFSQQVFREHSRERSSEDFLCELSQRYTFGNLPGSLLMLMQGVEKLEHTR